MAKEWTVTCKNCGATVHYSDWTYRKGEGKGQSRVERCPECRKKHNKQTALMGAAYFDIKPRVGMDMTQIQPGRLGKLIHEKREHRAENIPSKFNPEKFGVKVEDIKRIFEWFDDPTHQVAVVVGPTGSGKSTALPYYLINPPGDIPKDRFTRYGQVLITQPRIQATRNIPAFVAKDLFGSNIGTGLDIGFKYKGHPYSDWRNRLVYATDGTLINWIVGGQLSNLSLIMIDEAHERSLNIDLILGLLKKLLPRYKHLKLIVASATIDADLFLDYFGKKTAALIEFQGKRIFKVAEYYQSEEQKLPYDDMAKLTKEITTRIADKVIWLLNEIEEAKKKSIARPIKTTLTVGSETLNVGEQVEKMPNDVFRESETTEKEPGISVAMEPYELVPGDILAFLQGEKPIEDAVAKIRKGIRGNAALENVDVYPLYTTLPQEEQNLALLKKKDESRTRVVVTTNVAETSLTVDGIVYVVDSGLINQADWDVESETKRVEPVLHSQAGCKQRWGRGGRVQDGQAYCLYTKEQFETLFPRFTVPQIQRSNLETVVLAAKAAGVDDIVTFDWIQKPPMKELLRAPRILQNLGALDPDGYLTEHGIELQSFGEEPAFAHFMAMADRYSCAIEAATLIPMIKHGGMRALMRNDKRWDALTKRTVRRIHKSLQEGCQDDIELFLKLFTAWSDADIDGLQMTRSWSFANLWQKRIKVTIGNASLDSSIKTQFIEQAVAIENRVDLDALFTRQPGDNVPESLKSMIEEDYLDCRSESWAYTHFINHGTMKQLIEAERNALIETLSGHKKEDERRAIDFSLLDRVRILFALCFPENRYRYDLTAASGGQEPDRYVRWDDRPLQAPEEEQLAVFISMESVGCQKRPSNFVCGRKQIIKRRITPDQEQSKAVYVSCLSLVRDEWLDFLSRKSHDEIELARFIAGQTRDQDGNPLDHFRFTRLMADQLFPLGSRFTCDLVNPGDMASRQIVLRDYLNGPRETIEDFRGDDVASVEPLEVIDIMDNEETDLADTVLQFMKKPAVNPEDESTQLAAGLLEIEEDIEQSEFERQFRERARLQNENEWQDTISNRFGDFYYWILEPDIQGQEVVLDSGFTAEVVGYQFNDSERTGVLLHKVDFPEPFERFHERFTEGDTVSIIVTAYDEWPGDTNISLITVEPLTGLEILIESEKLFFAPRGSAVKVIPIGITIQADIDRIDYNRRRVYATCLPPLETHLNNFIAQRRLANQPLEIDSVPIIDISQDKIFLLMPSSEPKLGLIHVVSVGGKGLYKPADGFQIGETCLIRISINYNGTSHRGLEALPDVIERLLKSDPKQRAVANLYWDSGKLEYVGRMTNAERKSLRALSFDPNYQKAIDDLYRFSNQIRTDVIDLGKRIEEAAKREEARKTWIEKAQGHHAGQIVRATVISNSSNGIMVEIEPGFEGWIPKNKLSWEGSVDPKAFQKEDIVEASIESINQDKYEVWLTMLNPANHPIHQFKVDMIVNARVSAIANRGPNTDNYGVFLKVAPLVDGLCHIKEMGQTARRFIEPKSLPLLYPVGKEVSVRIIEVNLLTKKLKLSILDPL